MTGLALLLLGYVAVAGGDTACSFIVDTNSNQCSKDADCTALGAAFEGTYCTSAHVCADKAGYCFNNAQCVDRNGGTEAYICRKTDHTCQGLLTRECPAVLAEKGDLRNDDAVVAGLVWMPSWNATLQAGQNGFDLARKDFATTAGGLPGVKGGKPRPVVVVACDIPFGAQDTNKQATDHLINDVNVPLILGPLLPDWLAYTVSQAIPKGIMVATPDPVYAGFSDIPGRDGLFFSNGVPSEATPTAQAQLVNVDETALRAGGLNRDIKVAMVTSGVGVGIQDAATFYNAVHFNGGKSAKDNAANYREFGYGDPNDATTYSQTFANAVVGLRDYRPDVLVCVGAPCPDIPPALEKALIAAGVSTPTVNYIMPYEAQATQLSLAVGTNEQLRKRILGVIPGRSANDIGVARYYERFQQAYPDLTPQPLVAATFDLMYFVTYAMAAVGDQPVTGTNIGQAMLKRLVAGGRPASNDPTNILPTFGTLSSGANIDVNGIEGVAHFDASGQVPDLEMQVWCVDKDPTKPFRFSETGVSYKVSGGVGGLQGTNTCF